MANWIDVEAEVEQSMQSYKDRLDEKLAAQTGFKRPPIKKKAIKRRTTSTTDPNCDSINHGTKRGGGYLMEVTVDWKHGIVTGIGVWSVLLTQRESPIALRHLERQIRSGIPMERIALDRVNDIGAVYRALEMLGITGYIPTI